MNSLPLFHRISGQPVIVLGTGEAADAKQRLVERAGGVVTADPQARAALAFVALDQPEAAAAALKVRGVLVNVVDRPDLCDFTVPSLLERGPVIVAVGTGGVSAGLAKALRLRLETLLPDTLGSLAEALGAARAALRVKWTDGAERRRAIDAALTAGGVLDPLAEHGGDAVLDWLSSTDAAASRYAEFTLTSGDPDDLTLRQARWLGGADVVLHAEGVPAAVLDRARADAVRQLLGPADAVPQPGRNVVVIRRG